MKIDCTTSQLSTMVETAITASQSAPPWTLLASRRAMITEAKLEATAASTSAMITERFSSSSHAVRRTLCPSALRIVQPVGPR